MPATIAPISAEMDPPTERRCVACGYNLHGLGDEPRCPECGLLNVPEGFRRQVWELVDSGKWFFSGFFSPFKKRPPGWWWSLDRPGDVKRAAKRAVLSIAICWVSLGAGLAVLSSIRLESTNTWFQLARREVPRKEGLAVFHRKDDRMSLGLCGIWDFEHLQSETFESGVRRPFYTQNQSPWAPVLEKPDRRIFATALLLLLLPLLLWVVPSGVGIWTQIRRGLPKFARAPRTILAASLYESHRLIYLVPVLLGLLILELIVRFRILQVNPITPLANARTELVHAALLAVFSATGWIGSLRSDYTRQIIRSGFHAVRIVAMYGILIPLAIFFGLFLLVHLS